MTKKKTLLFLSLLVCTLLGLRCKKKGEHFLAVRQIINKNCVSCHSQGQRPTALDSDDAIVKNGEAIRHYTIDSVSTLSKGRMPPTGDLSDTDKSAITDWLAAGGALSN